ncbi:hypothetical protein [Rhodopila sp.]|uniref:hypothetical protein n=1 Tax=Rhodopila sp. TaxID=2480087 RepID=UPI003D14374C
MPITNSTTGAAGRYEATVLHRFLPRCKECGSKHPDAYSPPLAPDECPNCGAPIEAAGEPVETPAVITDTRIKLGVWAMRVGAAIKRFSEKLK